MRQIEVIRSKSKDPSTQVGALIVSDNNRIRTAGFNGFPSRIEDLPERLHNREVKYSLIIHAEMNAILQAAEEGIQVKDCRMYCTLLPCNQCAIAITQVGIKEVITPAPKLDPSYDRWEESFRQTLEIFREAGVTVRFVKQEKIMFVEDEAESS